MYNKKNNKGYKMDRKLYNTLLRSIKDLDERKETYPDYSDISVMFKTRNTPATFSVPNKTEDGVVKTYSMVDKEELLNMGIDNDYLCKLERNYEIMDTNKYRKQKLFRIKGKKSISFNLNSNVKYKEYSDGFTIIDDLRKEPKLITMGTLIKYKTEYIGECYFNFKYILKLRSFIVNGKKEAVGRHIYKNNKFQEEVFLDKKVLSKIRRISLCRYGIKEKKET